ncbi:MAG: endonuclease domain-containing protein [Demequina sp.]|jgi:very-short-patch-repair endonuclease|nr:endonuclease domain-containing protein [Demequina sp.]
MYLSTWAHQMASDVAPRTFEQLGEVMSRKTITRALESGALTRLVPDQFCLTMHADSWLMRSRAAVEWAGPGAALTGLAALAVYGYAPVPIDLIQVAVPAGGHRSGPPWIRVRSLTMPFPTTIWSPATPLTSPELALVLGYGQVPPRRRATFLYRAIGTGLITAREASDLAGVLTRVPVKRELLARLKASQAGAESYLEERGWATVFVGKEFEDMVPQHKLRVGRERFRVDAFHLATRTAFEFDGDETHDEREDRKRDIRRDALLATIGVQTVRFARETVLAKPEWCQEIALETIDYRSKYAWIA